MARQLWLLRHGEAEPHHSKPDFDRALTARGERQAVAAGAGLARLGLEFTACYTSPKIRALRTAELACEALNIESEQIDEMSEDFTVDLALELIEAQEDENGRVLFVGHDPDFAQIVMDLTGGRIDFKKGGVAAISLTGRKRGELLVLLRPRELESLAISGADP